MSHMKLVNTQGPHAFTSEAQPPQLSCARNVRKELVEGVFSSEPSEAVELSKLNMVKRAFGQ